jgi:7,8-dihydroneopterin aldolase/epimerase/oxygenase
MDSIKLENIQIDATCGVNPEEKCCKQPFIISVTLYLDLSQAAKSDDVADTVHYGELYEKIIIHVTNTHYSLIEALAASIAELILKDELIEKCKIAVTKCRAKTNKATFPATVIVRRSRSI